MIQEKTPSQIPPPAAAINKTMTEAAIIQYITESFPGVETSDNFGYKFFFHGSERMLPFASLANTDYDYDRFSNLNHPGVFRLNIGIRKATFQILFGTAGVTLTDFDFAALDRIMPHPEYAAQFFVCVLNPGEFTWETVQRLLAEAHDIALQRNAKRKKPNDSRRKGSSKEENRVDEIKVGFSILPCF
jgi:hypothetical protein